MEPEAKATLKQMLVQSLYDYYHTNDGASYRLPKAMLQASPESEQAIAEIIEEGLAIDSGEGTDSLVLTITDKGLTHIEKTKNDS